MKSTPKPKSILYRIVRVLVILFGLLFIDGLPSLWNDLTPPPDLTTIDEFREWKRDKISSEWIYETGGETYSVLSFGEVGRFSGSGPAAYVFDSNGSFVD